MLAFAFRYMLEGLMDLMFFVGFIEIPNKVFYFHCILPVKDLFFAANIVFHVENHK